MFGDDTDTSNSRIGRRSERIVLPMVFPGGWPLRPRAAPVGWPILTLSGYGLPTSRPDGGSPATAISPSAALRQVGGSAPRRWLRFRAGGSRSRREGRRSNSRRTNERGATRSGERKKKSKLFSCVSDVMVGNFLPSP